MRATTRIAVNFVVFSSFLAACGDDGGLARHDAGASDGGSLPNIDAARGTTAADAGADAATSEPFAIDCASYLACVCGNEEAQTSDTDECKAKRSVVSALQDSVGTAASDAYCTQQIQLVPALAASCAITLPDAATKTCEDLILCQCTQQEPAADDSAACKANRATAAQFISLDAGTGCAAVLASLTCTHADAGVTTDAGADAGTGASDAGSACDAIDQAQAAAKSAVDTAVNGEIASYNSCALNTDCVLASAEVTCDGRDVISLASQAIAANQQTAFVNRALQLGAPYCNALAVRTPECPSKKVQPAAIVRCVAGHCQKMATATP